MADRLHRYLQIVALIASGAPLWSLFYALYKYPARRRKYIARNAPRRTAPAHSRTGNDEHDEEQEGSETLALLPTSVASGSHSQQSSNGSWNSNDESIEMQHLALPMGFIAEPLSLPTSRFSPPWPARLAMHTDRYANDSTLHVPQGSLRPRGPRPLSSSSITRRHDREWGT